MNHKNLATAKLAVMEEVGYCLKTASQGLNYTYASEAELIAALRPAMIKHGIVVAPVDANIVEVSRYETKRGTTMFVTRLIVTYRFSHDSGDHQDVVVVGEGGDAGDKGSPKAMTCAYKYALRQGFMIETGDDPDKFASQPAISEIERNRQYELALSAVKGASTQEVLEGYKKTYTDERDFTAEQIGTLDSVAEKRFTNLTSEAKGDAAIVANVDVSKKERAEV